MRARSSTPFSPVEREYLGSRLVGLLHIEKVGGAVKPTASRATAGPSRSSKGLDIFFLESPRPLRPKGRPAGLLAAPATVGARLL